MFKYIIKRLVSMVIILLIILTISFVLIKLIEPEMPIGNAGVVEQERREALGYNEPIAVQYIIYLENVFTKFDLGTSWKIDYMAPVTQVIGSRIIPTVLLNFFSVLIAVPLGIFLGIFSALKKNRWQDKIISTVIMIILSVPAYVFAFIIQYWLGFKLGLFPIVLSSLYDAGGQWLSNEMLFSMVLPVMSLSVGASVGLARIVRAELIEAITSDYMVFARAKGLSKRQALVKHALKNAMVPVLPTIIKMFIGITTGSIVIEQIFAVNGLGQLYLKSIILADYDVFMGISMFYTVISLAGTIIVDISYGFLDPRVRMGAKR